MFKENHVGLKEVANKIRNLKNEDKSLMIQKLHKHKKI